VKIIGVCGRKRHGKDTVGQFIKQNNGYTPIAFADPIKRIAMDLYGLSYEQVYGGPGVDREEIDPRWGVSPRHILQQLGTEVARSIHKDTWVRYAFDVMDRAVRGEKPLVHFAERKGFFPADSGSCSVDRWVITDVRFENECETIQEKGGVVLRVTRASLLAEAGSDLHASETGIDDIVPDYDLRNDGTLSELEAAVRNILAGLA